MLHAATDKIKTLLTWILSWAALSLLLNLPWEIAQLPLYAIWEDESAARITYAVLHCTAGDALIATASYLLTGAVCRDSDWVSSMPWRGGALATSFGLAYTLYSEWHNVYQAGAWAYSPAMPLVFGIGLSPLLQWLVIPLATLVILRAYAGMSRRRKNNSSNPM